MSGKLLKMLVIQRKMTATPCKMTSPPHIMMSAPHIMLAATHLMFAKDQRGGLKMPPRAPRDFPTPILGKNFSV